MSKHDKRDEFPPPFKASQPSQPKELPKEPSAASETALPPKSAPGMPASSAEIAGNEPDGDASGRPGSTTTANPSASDAARTGQVRVKALKTVLHGGMSYGQGETFTMDQKDFDARKDRGELELA